MNRSKIYLTAWVLLICLSALSCGKEPAPVDYRDGWIGSYDYDGERYNWWPTGSSPHYYFSGSLTVNALEDSSVRIELCDSTAEIIDCRVDKNGKLVLSGNQYRGFKGEFIGADSLYFCCSNFSPGAGAAREFHCKKRK
ncbi:MAG: hypothetical protein IKN29_06170 [Bacteroidales bacterium]|nr:hypothetical protein [Bacteroidales bacterium]